MKKTPLCKKIHRELKPGVLRYNQLLPFWFRKYFRGRTVFNVYVITNSYPKCIKIGPNITLRKGWIKHPNKDSYYAKDN